MTTQQLADLYERLQPFLDWDVTEGVGELRARLIEITKLLNSFSDEVLHKEL